MKTEAKTLKEWFGNATRGNGRKFRLSEWPIDEWFEPIFLFKGYWNGVDESGDSLCFPESDGKFELKKTETRWLWANVDGEVNPIFGVKPTRSNLRWDDYTIKLDWSATEFEVSD